MEFEFIYNFYNKEAIAIKIDGIKPEEITDREMIFQLGLTLLSRIEKNHLKSMNCTFLYHSDRPNELKQLPRTYWEESHFYQKIRGNNEHS